MADALSIVLAYSPAPREVAEWKLVLPAGSTVADAIAASPLREQFPSLDLESLATGVWGREVSAGQLLRNGDRVEVYRPLQVDPKVARRERFRSQGARAAGLFARKRAG